MRPGTAQWSYHNLVSRLFKKAAFSPTQPRRAETRRSPGKAAASEEAKRTCRYVERSERGENAAGSLFQQPARTLRPG